MNRAANYSYGVLEFPAGTLWVRWLSKGLIDMSELDESCEHVWLSLCNLMPSIWLLEFNSISAALLNGWHELVCNLFVLSTSFFVDYEKSSKLLSVTPPILVRLRNVQATFRAGSKLSSRFVVLSKCF
jgi:hypothetical protein